MDKKLWFNLADCYKTLRKVGDAESCYNSILEVYEDDTDAMLQLAQIMEMDGRKAEALDLVNEVLRIRKEAYYAPPLEVANDPKSRRNARRARNNRNKERLTQAEKQVINERRTQQTTAKFNKLSLLLPAQLAGDKKAINEFLDTAAELVDDFRNTKALYPDERGKPFTGYIPTAGRRAAAEAQEIQLKRMAHRLQESLTYDAAPEVTEPEATEFRGLNFDDWLWVFCQYALALARYADVRDAYDVCAAAKEANVFYRSKNILTIIWSTWLSCAILKEDSESVSTILRLFLTKYQFQNESYNLFTACLTASRHANDVFHSAANLKYLLRHIKLLDSCLSGQHRANAAHLTNIDPETDKEFVPKDFDIALITLYGHMLSAGKSYISALHYYTRAYAMNPLDPLIRFCIALCYLQRSMQRQSENRTWQVAQATVFLKLYEEARLGLPGVVYRKQTEEGNAPQDVTGLISDKEKKRREMFRQEVEYNFGRAWMMYGLTHLAIPRFENVLKIGEEQAARRKERDDKRKQKEAEKGDVMDVDSPTPDSIIKNGGDMMNVDPKPNQEEVEEQDLGILDEEEDLSLDAAYNLQMMYITNGAEELAMEVTEKYLVI